MGQVLREKPRDEFVLSTKVGASYDRRPPARRPISSRAKASARSSISAPTVSAARSRKAYARLGLDRVDIALIHDPDDHLDQAIADAHSALARLRDERVVQAIGVGTNSCATAAPIVATETDVDHVLLAGRITLLDSSGVSDVLPLCEERAVSVIAAGVFNSGILASPRSDAHFEYREASDAVRGRALKLERICESRGVPLTAAAIRYPLRHAAVDAVIISIRRVDELDANIAAFEVVVPDEFWDELT